MTTYAQWMQLLLPGGLSGRWAQAWVRAHADTLDDFTTLAQDAVFVRGLVDPEHRGRQCADDALPYHGADRQIPRAPGETADSWRARLDAAWDTWGNACTAGGVLDAAELLGYGRPLLFTQRALPLADGHPTWWARFRLVYDTGAPIEGADEHDARAALRVTLRTWASARDRIPEVILRRGAVLWDEGWEWDDPAVTWDMGDEPTVWASDPWDDGWTWDTPTAVWDYFA